MEVRRKKVILPFLTQLPLARAIVTLHADEFELCTVDWKTFADGTPNIFVHNVDEKVRQREVIVLLGMCSTKDWFAQYSLTTMLPHYSPRSLAVAMPYFPTGTMERVEEEGQVATAYTLARMMSFPGVSSVRFFTLDLHALATRFVFPERTIPVLLSAVPLLVAWAARVFGAGRRDDGEPPYALCFPDEGAKKRYGKVLESAGVPLLVCSKVRIGDRREVALHEGCPAGLDVIIVDDLVQSGGTLVACRSALVASGARSVSAFVVHGVFPGESWRAFAAEARAARAATPPPPPASGGDARMSSLALPAAVDGRVVVGSSVADEQLAFRYFVVTDSVPTTAAAVRDVPPFVVLSIAGVVADALCRHSLVHPHIDGHTSVGGA